MFINILKEYLEYIAEIAIILLEFIGIVIIVVGAFKTLIFIIEDSTIKTSSHNIKISLGNALALGLEFKMGAEIIKTVLIKELSELLVLGAIIFLRAILSFLIHWEIKVSKTK